MSCISQLDGDVEVVALALERLQVAVELAETHDAVEVGGAVVVIQDQVPAGRPVADVPGGRIVPVGRTVERQLAGSGAVFRRCRGHGS
jgi:hypothetical protein